MAVGLSVSDLQSSRPKSDEDLMTFVHTYDPAYPGLLNDIKSRISRLFTSKECRPIFGGSRIIESRREPPSLLRMFQHSRFEDSSDVTKSLSVGFPTANSALILWRLTGYGLRIPEKHSPSIAK